MSRRPKLEVCAFFADEFRAALAAEKRGDVEVVLIQGACDERLPASMEAQLAPIEASTLRLMCACSGGTACQKSPHSCFEFLLGPDKVDTLLGEGAHLLTPAMARAYPETLQSSNENPESLRASFAESVRTWVVVDIGVAPLTAAEQAAFLDATGGAMELLPTEPHLLRANLRAALAQWEAGAIEARSAGQIALLQHRLADYTMAYDLISRLIPHQGEQIIVHAIMELFYMLCAPRAVHLLLVQGGGKEGDANAVEEPVQLFSLPADSGKEEDCLRAFLRCPAPWGEIEAPQGFYFQIRQDEQALGVVVIEGAFLPEHRHNYLDLALLLMPILRLALHNARSYERLCDTERELRASQMELEQRVEERTRELCESEERLKEAQRIAHVGSWRLDVATNHVVWSEELYRMLGLNPDLPPPDYTGHHRFFTPESWDRLSATLPRTQETGDPYELELEMIRADGRHGWMLARGEALRGASGSIATLQGVAADITDRKQAEKALKDSEQRFRDIVNSTDGMVWEADAATFNFTFISQQAERLLGYPVEDWLKPGFWVEHLHPGDKAWATEHCVSCTHRLESHDFEYRFIAQDGRTVWLRDIVTVVAENGMPRWLRGIMVDITERKEYEEELKRSNTELEQFSYAVSHDMRQPLRMISSYLQLIEMSLAGQLDKEKRSYFNFAIDGAKRIDQMLVALLEYSRIGRMGEPPTWIDSRAALDEALQFLQPAIAEAQAKLSITGDWPRILVSHDEILRLLQNLVGNAVKFRVAGRTPEIAVTGEVSRNEWRLCIADNGVGIIPDQIKRLFQVFQRLQSREAYEGTGIGLALCRKIAEHHKGRIWAESAGDGKGSKFCVVLTMTQEKTVSAIGEARL